MNSIYLKKGVKYRKETNYILICDCVNFIDFRLPLSCWSLMERLQRGFCNSDVLTEFEMDVLTDLYSMSLLSDKKGDAVDNFNNLSNISYNESEFFK